MEHDSVTTNAPNSPNVHVDSCDSRYYTLRIPRLPKHAIRKSLFLGLLITSLAFNFLFLSMMRPRHYRVSVPSMPAMRDIGLEVTIPEIETEVKVFHFNGAEASSYTRPYHK